MKTIEIKKKYEAPAFAVTVVETNDVITVSALIGQNSIGTTALGYATIEIDF